MNFENFNFEKNTRFIITVIAIIFIFSTIFSIINLTTTYMFEVKDSPNYIVMNFSNSGLLNFYRTYSLSFDIFKFSAGITILFTTISAMIIALNNYISTSKTNLSIVDSNKSNSELNNETAKINFFNHEQNHKILFFDFIKDYLKINNKIHPSTINKYILYNKIFILTEDKKILLSDDFFNLRRAIIMLISDSNNEFKRGRIKHFSHRMYQDKSIEILKDFGVELSNCFRREFLDIEGEVFLFLDEINSIYGDKQKLPEREYI